MKSEHQEQKEFLEWLAAQYPRLRENTFAVPNGSHKGRGGKAARQIAILKAEGFSNGCPDLFIMHKQGEFGALAIEMKTEDGGNIPEEQLVWRDRLVNAGYAHAFCAGAESAKTAVRTYLQVGLQAEGER